MERRVRPWINKKIIEYIGEEEATLVDFVCSKVPSRDVCLTCTQVENGSGVMLLCLQVMAHSTPQGILDDVAMVSNEPFAAVTFCAELMDVPNAP